MNKIFVIIVIILILISGTLSGTIINVPADYTTIAEAIHFAVAGDTVLVAPGDYGPTQMLLQGKYLVIKSSGGAEVTTIEGAFVFIPTDIANPVIDGFTMWDSTGQMIVCFYNSNPIVKNCIFRDGTATDIGGAVMTASANVTFENCIFANNKAGDQGSAIFSVQGDSLPFSRVTLSNCEFLFNKPTDSPTIGATDIHAGHGSIITINNCLFRGDSLYGASIIEDHSQVVLNNCTVSGYEFLTFEIDNDTSSTDPDSIEYDNYASGYDPDSMDHFLEINNSIIDHGEGLAFLLSEYPDTVLISQSILWGVGPVVPETTITLDGYIRTDPLFCDTANLDYHISDTSPCTPAYNSWGVLIGKYDIGCSLPYLCGDVEGEGAISISDCVFLVNFIFSDGFYPSPPIAADVDCSGEIEIGDAVYIIQYIIYDGPAPCANCK